MGCMGMSMDDFCRCIPSEFQAAYEAWSEMREKEEQSRWERMRMQCLCSLQPYSKTKLRASDLMEFPWEKPSADEKRPQRKELSREEIMERYREAKKQMGLR